MTNLLQIILITMGAIIVISLVLVLLINSTRNFFTKSRYVRVLTFHDSKLIKVEHFKKDKYNDDNGKLLNPNHIFTLKGYTTLVFTEHTSENINPLDFESKYDSDKYKTGIFTNLIGQTFDTLKSNKLDMLKISVILNVLTLAMVAYLLVKYMGVV